MAILYSDENKNSWFYQPNFTKSRHRYRGRVESSKLNLEISQFNYDIRNINKKINSIMIDTLSLSSSISRGEDSISYSLYRNSKTFNTLDGLPNMRSKVENLKNRVTEMERKNV